METKVITMASHEFGTVRKIRENNTILYCAKDIATALGYKDPTNAIKLHCRWVAKHHLPHPQSKNKTIEMSFIPEGDVWRLICHSKLPNAEQFEKWIFDDVVPTVANTGKYEIPKPAEQLTLEEHNPMRSVLEATGHSYRDKTFNGEPVITLNDIAYHFGISGDAAKYILTKHGTYGKDYYKINGAQMIKFKRENKSCPNYWSHLILVSKSGFILLAEHYKLDKKVFGCFIKENPKPALPQSKTELPTKPTVDDCISALNVLRYCKKLDEKSKETAAAKGLQMDEHYNSSITAYEKATRQVGMLLSAII